jgi:hypothetical protein
MEIMTTHFSGNRRLLAPLVVAVVALACTPADALIGNSWNGSNGNYNTPGNWSEGNVPNSGDQGNIFTGTVTLSANSPTAGALLVTKVISSAAVLNTNGFRLTSSGTIAVDNTAQLNIGAPNAGISLQAATLALTNSAVVAMSSTAHAVLTSNVTLDATSTLFSGGTLDVTGTVSDAGNLRSNFNNNTVNAGTFTLAGTAANPASIDANGVSMTINATTFNFSNTNSTIDVSDFAGSLNLQGSPSTNIGATVNVGDSAALSFGTGFFGFGFYQKSNGFFIPEGSVNLNGGPTAARAATVNTFGTYFTSVNTTGFASMPAGAEFDGASSINVAANSTLNMNGPSFRGTTFSNQINLNGPGTINMNGNSLVGFSGSSIPFTDTIVNAGAVFNWEGSSGANASLTIENGELDVFATSIQSRLVFNGFFITSVNGYDGNMTIGGGSVLNVAGAPWTLFGTMTLGPGALVQGQTLTINGNNVPAGSHSLTPTNSVGASPDIQAPVVLGSNATVFLAGGTGLILDGATTYAGGSVSSAPFIIPNQPFGTMVQNGNATVSANTTLFCNTYDMDGASNTAVWTINTGVTLTQQAWFLDASNSTSNPFHSTINLGGTLDVETHAGLWTLAGGTLNVTGASGIVQHDKLILGSGGAIGSINVVNGASCFISSPLESAATTVAGGNQLNLLGYLVVQNSFILDANSVTTQTGNFAFEVETTPTAGIGSVFNVNGGDAQFFDGIPGAPNLSINIQGTGDVGFYDAANLKSLHILAGGSATIAVGVTHTLFTDSLVIDGGSTPTGSLGITDNKVIVEATANHSAVFATLQAQVLYGNTHVFFDGIYDPELPANYGVAVMDNAVLGKANFGGIAVTMNSILISQELLGDANADGKVDMNDLNTVLSHLGVATLNWTSGNFDGQPTIDLTDLNDVLNNLGLTNPNASVVTGDVIATPEPASLALLALAVPLFVRRRSR